LSVGTFKPSAILEVLERHRVQYVVIGGIAARLHGWPRLIEDLDVTPAVGKENLRRLALAFTTMTLVTKHGFLDLAFRPTGRRDTRI